MNHQATNKKKNIVLIINSILPIIIILVSLMVLPENVPNYFLGNGRRGEMSSKYLNLLWGIVLSCIGFSFLYYMKQYNQKNGNVRDGLYLNRLLVILMVMFEIFTIILLYNQYAVSMNLQFKFNPSRVFMIGLGVLYIILGLIMPLCLLYTYI